MLGKDQKSLAFTFFRPADVSDGKLSGQSFRKGTTGAPILIDVPGAMECRVISIVEQGDHHIVVGEVIDAHLNKPLTGRPGQRYFRDERLWRNRFLWRLSPTVLGAIGPTPQVSRSIKCALGNTRHGSCAAGVPRPSQTCRTRWRYYPGHVLAHAV